MIQDAGHSAGLLQETERYELLWQWGASPPRRELVAFLVISMLRRALRVENEARAAGAPSVRLSRDRAPLLAFVPSKWIWHFGVFTGLAVVAIGLESDRFDRGRVSARVRWVAAGDMLAVSLFAASDSSRGDRSTDR